MSAKKIAILLATSVCLTGTSAHTAYTLPILTQPPQQTWAYQTIAEQLGWVVSDENYCGGYYLEQPFNYPVDVADERYAAVTSNHGLISQTGTSFLEDKVTVIRGGQEITSNKAYVYRNTQGNLSAVDVIGDVHLREPNTLVIAKKGRYNFKTQTKSMQDILYRTALIGRQIVGPNVNAEERHQERKVTGLTAWGEASEFSQTAPLVYELSQATFSTCPPINPAWQVKASHIVIDKNSGRGYATNARLVVKDVPIFYAPYFSFSIDKQRKTGFLWPTVGLHSDKWGPYVLIPFYWNLAPNYDLTTTGGFLRKRGVQLTNDFRYLTSTSGGKINLSVLPSDREFAKMKLQAKNKYFQSTNTYIQAELNRLLNSSTTRKSFVWRDNSRFNEHWSSHIDFNYAGDDYYLQDFGSTLNEITENQLLQEGDIFYKGQNWNFTGRLQAYQTLHPLIDKGQPILNQYRRVPQLILNGDYPNQLFGLEFFINNELTNFSLLKTPGSNKTLPIGSRIHTQPGISLPLNWPFFYINPRLQFALTSYNLRQTMEVTASHTIHRALPIFDVATGMSLNRTTSLFNHLYQQTLEPQLYYTYIPYRNQASIPIFDTTVNTLNYDQIFNYNRFTGLDRIGDANQIGVGITTRFIDQQTGLEKVKLGVGEIIYFANRKVTLCNDTTCTDNPKNHSNKQRLSPVSGNFEYHVNPLWRLKANTIWNPVRKQIGNATVSLNYQSDNQHIINMGYSFARNGEDILAGIQTNTSANNLKVTDFSVIWPIIRNVTALGRISHDWGGEHLQNLLYGLQYDTCCWAVRLVGGKVFTKLDKNNKPKYNTETYIQFDLKGLGDIGSGNPSKTLTSITGFNPQFGQDI